MKPEEFHLNEIERKNKEMYLSDRNREWYTAPMSYEEYYRLVSTNTQIEDLRAFYRDTTKNGTGLTITPNKIYSQTNIFLSLHGRYSYPILHNHDFVELIYVLNGSCTNFINGKAIVMNRGDFCFMAPSTVHAMLAVNDNDVIFNVLLHEESFSQYFSHILTRSDMIGYFFKNISVANNATPYLLFKTNGHEKIMNRMVQSFHEFTNKNLFFEDLIGAYVNEIFIELSRCFNPETIINNSETNAAAFIHPILNFIKVNYNSVTLKELSDIFSYSEAYLSKLIKKNTGQNFKQIVETARLDEAKYLMQHTDYTLTEISQKVGYFDSSHMNKNFVKLVGLPPNKWLKQHNPEI